MINFRFHLVSLVAVFLALTVGIVMGATVIDRAVVDSLNNRISAVSDKADKRKLANDELAATVNRLNDFIGESEPYIVNGRLAGVPVGVIATRGVNADTVKAQVQMLQRAGATAPGILWLEDPWALKPEDATKLGVALGDTTRDPAALRDAAWRALAARLAAGRAAPAVVAPAGSPAAAPVDPLTALTAAGFVTLEGVGDQGRTIDASTFPGTGARALVVTGPGPGRDPSPLARAGARALAAAGIPTVAGEVYVEGPTGPKRGTTLAAIRDDQSLAAVSTVDDVELPEGQMAVVLAEADLGRRPPVTGHYGFGTGAQSSLPPWPG